MTYFIDRRLNGKNKSAVNRQRFLRRYKRPIDVQCQHRNGALHQKV